MTTGIIRKAIEFAEKSRMYPYRIGCVIFKGKKIISCGYNQKRTSKQLPDKYKKFIETLHAEQHAIMCVRNKALLDSASMLVIRINRRGKLVMAKPCETCMKSIIHFNIKNIFYSNPDGEIILEKINL